MNTVDLSEKIKAQEEAARQAADLAVAKKKLVQKKSVLQKKTSAKAPSRAEAIDKIYDDKEDFVDEGLKRIDRPKDRATEPGNIYKLVTYFLVFVIILGAGYIFFTRPKQPILQPTVALGQTGWYSVKLTNGEIYYGQIKDLSSDPVVIENVYYNYDQLNPDSANVEKKESGNLRLVKRGKEIQGPDGTMSLVRSQVVYMEPMKEDSKVLKAILEYEK